MSAKVLAALPEMTDECGCSLMDGRCDKHAAMMGEIHAAWQSGSAQVCSVIYSLADGYGTVGYVPEQGYDWSGVRDSSTDQIEIMYAAVRS